MRQYLDLLQYILDNGIKKDDRTGVGTISWFGYQMRFNLEKGFPLLTTKKVFIKGIIHELLWFLKGDTNIKYLVENPRIPRLPIFFRHWVSVANPHGIAHRFCTSVFHSNVLQNV